MQGYIKQGFCAAFGVLLLLNFCSPTEASSKVLEKDTKMFVQGWSVGDEVKFKKDTAVTTNDLGEVAKGTLAEDAFLRPVGWQSLINDYYYVSAYTDVGAGFGRRWYPYFERRYNMALPAYGHLRYKSGTSVEFNELGEVLSGTISDQAVVQLQKGRYGFIGFKKDTELTFREDGSLAGGVLSDDTKLRPVGWRENDRQEDNAGYVEFKGKKEVSFNEQGEVLSGTLLKTLKWAGTAGTTVELKAGSKVEFSEAGVSVVKD